MYGSDHKCPECGHDMSKSEKNLDVSMQGDDEGMSLEVDGDEDLALKDDVLGELMGLMEDSLEPRLKAKKITRVSELNEDEE